MLLFNIFLEIDAQHVSSPLHDTLLTRTELEFALKKSVASYRCLQNPEKIAAYRYWLQHCEQAMKDRQETPLLPLLMDALVSDDSPLSAEASCEVLTQLFYLNTRNQSDGLAIAEIGHVLIDRPIAFAAFLRCLCQHGVEPQQILSSYLLHNFFRYYLNTLGTKNNAIEQLFQLLQAFPETKSLAKAAQDVHSDERGFASYALDGCTSRSNLFTINKTTIPLRFTPHPQNLEGLHALFGSDFLMGVLFQWQAQKQHPLWSDFVTNLFNRADVIDEQLPTILNNLHDNLPMQQALSEILDDETLQHFIARKNGNILCLIPFCPQIVGAIQRQDLATYLTNIRQRSSSGIGLIIGLLALVESVKHAAESVSTLCFNTLMDAVLEEPFVLEDESIVRKLRKFSIANHCISNRIGALEAELDLIINSQVQNPLIELDYITVEDVWRKVAMQVHSLQEIETINTTCPADKYGLYIRIAQAFYKQQRVAFNINNIVAALHVTPLISFGEVSAYERLVIELLAAIDDESFRNECIERLDSEDIDRTWRTFSYGGSSRQPSKFPDDFWPQPIF